MLDRLDLHCPGLLAYRASGIITQEDVRSATHAFDALLSDHDIVHLYVEIEDLSGFEARALWLDLVYGLQRFGKLRQIGRVALVTDAEWIRHIARLEARLLPIGRLSVYSPDRREEARDWIRAAPDALEPPVSMFDDFDAWVEQGGLEAAWAGEVWDSDDEPMAGAGDATRPRSPRFGHTVHRTHVLLRDIAERLGTSGTTPAYHALRAVLHVLRDRLPDAEAADLAAQLTTIVRGVFYEGYRPHQQADKLNRAAFIDAVGERIRAGAPFSTHEAIAAVGGALADAVSEGEWNQVLGALSHDVRALFEAPVSA